MTQPDCACREALEDDITKLREAHLRFERAFPDIGGEPDIHGHRQYHEAKIEAAKAEERFWVELRNEVIRRGLIYGIIILLGLAGVGLLVKLGVAWK